MSHHLTRLGQSLYVREATSSLQSFVHDTKKSFKLNNSVKLHIKLLVGSCHLVGKTLHQPKWNSIIRNVKVANTVLTTRKPLLERGTDCVDVISVSPQIRRKPPRKMGRKDYVEVRIHEFPLQAFLSIKKGWKSSTAEMLEMLSLRCSKIIRGLRLRLWLSRLLWDSPWHAPCLLQVSYSWIFQDRHSW